MRFSKLAFGLLGSLLLASCGGAAPASPSASPASAAQSSQGSQAAPASSAAAAAKPPANTSQFIIGSLEEPASMSPLIDLPHHFPLHIAQTMMFDSLIQYLPDGTIGPKLATSWTVSPDGKEYTFKLDPKAKWWDGQPVTADDVKFTFDTM